MHSISEHAPVPESDGDCFLCILLAYDDLVQSLNNSSRRQTALHTGDTATQETQHMLESAQQASSTQVTAHQVEAAVHMQQHC
jgi:hypothetical protein